MAKSLEEVKLDNLLWLREGMLAKLSELERQIEEQRRIFLAEIDAKSRAEMGAEK